MGCINIQYQVMWNIFVDQYSIPDQIQETVIDNVYSGSSEQPKSIEPIAPAAGTVDSQNGSGLVM